MSPQRFSFLCFWFVLLAPGFGFGQTATNRPSPDLHTHAADSGTNTRYSPIRYLEDYSYLADKPATDFWERIKYIPLWPGGYLSIGGQHRLRYEYLAPVDIGEENASSVLLSRNLLHVDLHILKQLRIFGQIGAFQALGVPSAEAEPPDVDSLDITQLFIENSVHYRGVRIIGRVGRQEMSLGSTRWVSTRDGTNVRQAFDLARVTVTKPNSWSIEAFVGAVPALEPGAFDDGTNWQNRFWGAYATIPVLPKKLLSTEVFYLARQRPEAVYANARGRETRHTFGTRLFGSLPTGLDYVAHGLVQLGTIGEEKILAWGFAGALWQQLPGILEPVRIGVRGDALSGDQRPGDGWTATFQPLFPNQTFFSALPTIYPTNLYDVHPLARIEGSKFSFEGGCIFFFRQAIEDAVYAPPGAILVPASTSQERYTGAQASLALAYKADRHLSLNAEYSHVFPGPALQNAGGTSVDFFGAWATYTY